MNRRRRYSKLAAGNWKLEARLFRPYFFIRFHRRTRADQIAIAVRIVDARHGRPELSARGGTAADTPPARASTDAARRPRSMLPAVCGAFLSTLSTGSALPVDDLLNLLADRDHRVAEAIELVFRFALRRLDHHRPGNRERDRRRVEPVVHQPLRDVLLVDSTALRRA